MFAFFGVTRSLRFARPQGVGEGRGDWTSTRFPSLETVNLRLPGWGSRFARLVPGRPENFDIIGVSENPIRLHMSHLKTAGFTFWPKLWFADSGCVVFAFDLLTIA